MGATGVIANSKLSNLPEVNLPSLIRLIEGRGTRVAWTQAANCPCILTKETNQPDPQCVKCSGLGFFYFGPSNYTMPAEVGTLTALQQALIDEDGACVIRSLVQRIPVDTTAYTAMGPWRVGELHATVRPENKIGFYDRFVMLDSVIPYDQLLDIDEEQDPDVEFSMYLRYRAQSVNGVFSLTQRFNEGAEFELTNEGVVKWFPGMFPVGERVSVHYNTHPAFLIVDRPHAARQSATYRKPKDGVRVTPLGDPQELPLQAHLMLEFLRDKKPEDPNA